MDITSLIITFVGIIIILALYIISRMARSKLPQEKTVRLPNLKNEDGTRFSSVLDDIPARDGYTPNLKETSAVAKSSKETAAADNKTENKKSGKSTTQKQHILFISSNEEEGLDGNLVAKVLKKNGLEFGNLDIYHYFVQSSESAQKTSLFRVANGVDPWTLKKENLYNKKLAGLSIVLLTPSKIDDVEAIKLFVSTSHKISQEVNGVLKNQQQQLFTPKDETVLLDTL
jgi:cell division protein ZipA